MKSTIAEILQDYKQGKMIILMDDENRENEGDLIIAAEVATKEDINFMATYGRGLICLTLTEQRCKQLNLTPMVVKNTDVYGTNFTTSIEAASGVTTGISAADRARTIACAVAKDAKPDDIVQPGHIFPIIAKSGGVLERAGHTEAGCDIARLAGFESASVIVEILNDDGTMARRGDLDKFSKKHNIKLGTIADLISYRIKNEKTIERINTRNFKTKHATFKLVSFLDNIHNDIHVALVKGNIRPEHEVLVRVHMENTLKDTLGENYNNTSISDTLKYMADFDVSVFLLLRKQNNNTILQNIDNISADYGDDAKTYGVGAQILSDLGIRKMKILGSPRKLSALNGFGLEVVGYINEK